MKYHYHHCWRAGWSLPGGAMGRADRSRRMTKQ